MGDVVRIVGPAITTIAIRVFTPPPKVGIARPAVRLDGLIRWPWKDHSLIGRAEVRRLIRGLDSSLSPLRNTEFGGLVGSEWPSVLAAVSDTLLVDLPENLALENRVADRQLGQGRDRPDGQVRGRPVGPGRDAPPAPARRPTREPVTVRLLLDLHLDPTRLAKRLQEYDPDRVVRAGLGEAGAQAYLFILNACCVQLVEFVASRAEFVRLAQAEQIALIGDLKKDLQFVRTAIEPRHDAAVRFRRRYVHRVAQTLNHLELIGITVRNREPYPLSTAYLSLHFRREPTSALWPESTPGRMSVDRPMRVPEALAGARRVLIRGEAGSGKTTLLRWLAIVLADGSDEVPHGWGGSIPFFILLRRFSGKPLPRPEEFPAQIAPALAAEAPDGWVRDVLNHGSAVILVDGVDELPDQQREDARQWLLDLVAAFPRCRYVITSRPPAARRSWLAVEDFESFSLLPMKHPDVVTFIHYWHRAMRATHGRAETAGAEPEFSRLEHDLVAKISKSRALRQLTTNPLLCAVICALHHDRMRELPQDRNSLYRAALEMLLVRRDQQRGIPSATIRLSQREQEWILGRLAYWMIRNDMVDVGRGQAEDRVAAYLKTLRIEADPAEVLDHLVLRSGIIREPAEQRVDFLHRTFQDYLAAEAILDEGDLPALINNAHNDAWRDVIIMASGRGRREERNRILRGILHRGAVEPDRTRVLYLLAAACLDQMTSVDEDLVAEIRTNALPLVRPTSLEEAAELAVVGEVLLDLAPAAGQLPAGEARWLAYAIRAVGGDECLPLLADLASTDSPAVHFELASTWPEQVAPEHYADAVLSRLPLDRTVVSAQGAAQLASLERLSNLRRLSVLRTNIDDAALDSHPHLEWLLLEDCELEDLGGLTRLPALSTLKMHGCRIRSATHRIRPGHLAALSVLSSGSTSVAQAIVSKLSAPWLAFDGSVAASVSDLPQTPRLEAVAVLPGQAVGAALDVDDLWRAGEQIGGVVQPRHPDWAWIRPALSGEAVFPRLVEVTVSGWPAEPELDWLRALPGLRTVRVLVPSDEARARFKQANHQDYPYPPFADGVRRVLMGLPSLPELRVCVFELIRRAGSDVIATVLNHAATSSTVRAYAATVPAAVPGSPTTVTVNGVRLDR